MVVSFNSYAHGLMESLSAEAHEALLKSGTRVKLGDGQLFQNRGTVTRNLVVILQGNIRMMTIGEDGSALLTAILGPGQQINEITLFAGVAQTHDATAVGETELLVLSEAEYETFETRYPEIVKALLISNVHRMHQFVEILNDLRALPKSVVLARILYKNAKYMRATPSANNADLRVTQDDIAMFLGVSRAYLNQVMSQLGDEGLIELAYRKVRVLDIATLGQWIEDHLTYETVDDLPIADRPNSAELLR